MREVSRGRPLADRQPAEGTDARYEITPDRPRPRRTARRAGSITGLDNDWSYLGNRGHASSTGAPTTAPRASASSPPTSPPASAIRETRAAGRGDARRRLDRRRPADRRISGRREERGAHLHPRRPPRPARSPCPASAAPAASAATRTSSETFYSFASFNRPARSIRYDSATGAGDAFAEPRLAFEPGRLSRSARSSTLRRTAPASRCSWCTAARARPRRRSRPCSTAMAGSTSPRRRPSSRRG